MNARPIFPESRRRPLRIAVALVLAMVAVLLAAGCMSQQQNNGLPANSLVQTMNASSQIPTSVPFSQVSVAKTVPKDNMLFYVTITANPSKIAEGEETELNVTVVSGQGMPVSGATVVISAGGGTFISSREMTVAGKTDSSGIFRTTWGAYPPYIAGGYIIDAKVSKDGMWDAGGPNRVHVGIE